MEDNDQLIIYKTNKGKYTLKHITDISTGEGFILMKNVEKAEEVIEKACEYLEVYQVKHGLKII